jgi:hypothetical protein
VTAEITLPDNLVNAVSARGVRGETFGCAEWVTVEPAQFNLQGFGRQNLRISIRMPSTPAGLPNYYGMIKLKSRHPDGQDAGLTQARVCIFDKKVQGTPQVDNMVFTVAELSPSRYQVTARFLNNGDIHVMPRCRAVLTTLEGSTRKPLVLSSEGIGDTGILLPLHVRNFSGVLDVADVSPGTYRLTAIMEFDRSGVIQSQIGLEIVDQGAGKAVQVIDASRLRGGKTVINL